MATSTSGGQPPPTSSEQHREAASAEGNRADVMRVTIVNVRQDLARSLS